MATTRRSKKPPRKRSLHQVMGRIEAGDLKALPDLLSFTADGDDEIRNWATFAVGDLLTEHREKISDKERGAIVSCLQRRRDDPHAETRAEAVSGLARWGAHVPELVKDIRRGLRAKPLWDHFIEAAALVRSPALCADLRRVQARLGPGSASRQRIPIEEAIRACCGEDASTKFAAAARSKRTR